MRSIRVLLCILLIICLCLPIWSAADERSPRHFSAVTTFKGGIENKTLTFLSEGSDSSLVVSLPEDSRIESATIDIEGQVKHLQSLVIIDYTDTVNNKAWDDPNNQEYPVTSAPTKFKINAFKTTDYNDVNALDGFQKATMGGASSSGYPIQLYEFNLSGYSPSGLEVFWAGAYLNWNFANVDGMNVSIWNVTGNTWEIVGGYFAQPGVVPSGDIYINKSYTTNPMDYTHPSSKLLYVIVSGPLGIGFSYCEIYTNYISINLTQDSTPMYPVNPYLDIGEDDDIDWLFIGALSSKQSFFGEDFKDELQEHVNFGIPLAGKIDIPFEFGVASRGILYISNLTIVYATNKAPVKLTDIPSISFYEDSGWFETGFNITQYFQDIDDSLGNLTFELNGNTAEIFGIITPEYFLNFTSSANYFGSATFNISCRDRGFDEISSSDDTIVYSNNFKITVLPTDDPPIIQSINDEPVIGKLFSFTAYEDKYLNFTVIAEDIDGDDIDYSINITDPELILDDNKIIFSPTQGHVGFFNFTITATETNISQLYDYVNVSIKVMNTNDAPLLEDIADATVDEDVWLNLTVNAVDVDLPYDNEEKLIYNTNFTDSKVDTKLWNFNSETGDFSFLPNNEHVGIYFVNFSVVDNYGESDWCHSVIEVKNVNDPPSVEPISYLIVDADKLTPELENLTVSFSTDPATDPDIIHGDDLTYSWDFDTSDNIDVDTTGLSANWTYKQTGNYTITLTVSDSGFPELMNSTSITIQVLATTESPTDVDTDGDEESDKEMIAWWLWIILGLIVLLIILGSIMIFIKHKKRKGEPKAEAKPGEEKAEVAGPTAAGYPQYPSIPPAIPLVTPGYQPYMTQGVIPGEQPMLYPLPQPALPPQQPPQQPHVQPPAQQTLPPPSPQPSETISNTEQPIPESQIEQQPKDINST